MLPSLPVALEAICETMRLLAATAGNKTAGGEVLAERYWRQGSCPGDEALATMMLAPRENSRAGHLSSVFPRMFLGALPKILGNNVTTKLMF